MLFTFEMALQFCVSDEGMLADIIPKMICFLVLLNIFLESVFKIFLISPVELFGRLLCAGMPQYTSDTILRL
jgi:uncharacterized membrane protein YecN with MAPEG domain